MKIIKLISGLVLFQILFFQIQAQEITMVQGSFKILLSEKTVDLEFTYDSLQVGKYKNESDYVNKKVAEINKKYPGKGDAWALEWTAQRKQYFEPAFTNAFKPSSGKAISPDSKYTLIFNTSYIEQGFSTSAILVHKNPEVRGELILVENNDKTTILAKAKITKAMGKVGAHFETGEHLEGAYTEAGDGAGAFILNN
jgi:hypothetical protein